MVVFGTDLDKLAEKLWDTSRGHLAASHIYPYWVYGYWYLEYIYFQISPSKALAHFLAKCNEHLSEIVSLVRTGVTPSSAKILRSLIVIGTHARDVVERLRAKNVVSTEDFVWSSHMRYEVKSSIYFLQYVLSFFSPNGLQVIHTLITFGCELVFSCASQAMLSQTHFEDLTHQGGGERRVGWFETPNTQYYYRWIQKN